MVRRALASANNDMARRAMTAPSSSYIEHAIPDNLTDDQMTMANNQAFQQTSGHAIDSAAKAIRQINKRSKPINQT
eukprot:10787597-Heterocapsa_arctica.AAC.1